MYLNTVSCPRVQQNLVKLWNLVYLTLFLVLISIPAYHGTKLQDYDLIISNGNSLLFTNSISDESTTISVVPYEKNWKARIVSIVPDLQNDLTYFTVVTGNSSYISVYNLENNQTTQLYSSLKGSIVSLTLYQNHLYWCDGLKKSVLRIGLLNDTTGYTNETINNSPEVVLTDKAATFESLAINPIDGTIYYTKWGRNNGSTILSYDREAQTAKVIINNVYQPHGLFVDNSHLYWIDNPPGIYFDINRIPLNTTTNKRDRVYRGQNQHPYTISAHCSTIIYWSDVMNNRVWRYDMRNHSLNSKNYLKEGVYGFSHLDNSTCETLMQIDADAAAANKAQMLVPVISKSTNTAPTNLKKDCPEYDAGCINYIEKKNEAANLTPNKVADKAKTSYKILDNNQIDSVSNESAKVTAYLCKPEENYCPNGASCLKLDNQIFCLCQPGFSGTTCNDHDISVAATVEQNQPLEKSSDVISSSSPLSSWSSSNYPFLLSCIVFSIITTLLLIVILTLALKIRRLDAKPRIRRRVVVNHRSDLDNNPSSSTVCEMIDIENCCNMNVCETPCYERVSGAAAANVSKSRTRKNSVKEDKKCLLSSS